MATEHVTDALAHAARASTTSGRSTRRWTPSSGPPGCPCPAPTTWGCARPPPTGVSRRWRRPTTRSGSTTHCSPGSARGPASRRRGGHPRPRARRDHRTRWPAYMAEAADLGLGSQSASSSTRTRSASVPTCVARRPRRSRRRQRPAAHLVAGLASLAMGADRTIRPLLAGMDGRQPSASTTALDAHAGLTEEARLLVSSFAPRPRRHHLREWPPERHPWARDSRGSSRRVHRGRG